MKKIIFIFLMLAGGLVASSKPKPNVVLLFVDDYGWADVGYRNPVFHTPNIDQLKQEGLEFTRAYIATATCSPSRASLLTGKEPVRLPMPRHITHEDKSTGRNKSMYNYWPMDPAHMPSLNWLPLKEITYAERLREFGYYNMFIGKWHLGHEPYHPVHQGFDEQYGTSNFGHPDNYYPPYFKHLNPLKNVPKDKYLTDALTDKAVSFITEYDKAQPFMLSLWYYGVHGPQIGRRDLVAKYKKAGLEGRYAEYAAMVEAVDESVGRVREALQQKGIADNTIVLLLSDQGGYFSNAPLRGTKNGGQTICEGGSRVPFIVYYPGVTTAGTTCDTPVESLDIYPTLVEAASGKPCTDTQIQGRSLLPLLHGKSTPKRNLFLYRSYENQYCAVISGNWKLIKNRNGKYELYNLKNDIGEVSNLVYMRVSMAQRLKDILNNWEKEAVPDIE